MAFIGQSGKIVTSAPQPAPSRDQAPRPILTTICNLLGVLVLLAGLLAVHIAIKDPDHGISAAAASVAASLGAALVIFGIGQTVSFLARTATATERTAAAAERSAVATERGERRAQAVSAE